jgi:S-adenosylmethionine/arginine decarboxylase-like enzyme
VFTCGTTVNPETAAEVLIERFGSKNHSITEIKRGVVVTV